jgi:hypothetical protein
LSERYLESNFYDAFKAVRNRIRRHDPGTVVLATMERLQSFRGDLDRFANQPPWLLLLLIKWTLLYGDFLPGEKRPLGPAELNRLINLMHNVDGAGRLPTQYDHILLFFRAMSYQQLWIQESATPAAVARQSLLFRGLDPSHRFRAWFEDTIGVALDSWIDLSVMLLAGAMVEQRSFIPDNYFQAIYHVYPPEVVRAFIRSLARAPGELKTYLEIRNEEHARTSSEIRERTPLTRYPLLSLGNRHFYYCLPVLLYSLQNFVYDRLRERNPSEFMAVFGRMFEGYVRRGVELLEREFLDETALRRRLGATKVVDFLIQEPGYRTLIDAKGVEVGHRGMVSHRGDVIAGATKSSVIKAILQANDTAEAIARLDGESWDRENSFLLIVTFKHLYLGRGLDLYDAIGSQRMRSALRGGPGSAAIPLENIYIVSIHEFDYLVSGLRSTNRLLGEFLRHISTIDRNSDIATRRFTLAQHLEEELRPAVAPPYAAQEFESLFERGLVALGGDPSRLPRRTPAG